MLKRLNHPNIVKVYDFSDEPPDPYILMEYNKGTSLRKLIDNRAPLSVDNIVSYFEQILSALKHAHKHAILHRDMQPSNILISNEGQVKIVDFGLARNVAIASNTHVMGLPPYMPLEQLRGMHNMDERSDVYSVGMCLYEALAGRLPFRDKRDITDVLSEIKRANFKPPSRYVKGLPPALVKIVMKAIKRDPKERYQSAAEMLDALENFRHETSHGHSPGSSKYRNWALRIASSQLIIWLVFLVVVVIFTFFTIKLFFS